MPVPHPLCGPHARLQFGTVFKQGWVRRVTLLPWLASMKGKLPCLCTPAPLAQRLGRTATAP